MEEIDENEDNYCQPCRMRSRDVEYCRAGSPDHERHEHACTRPQEQRPAAETVDEERCRRRRPKVENLENSVDQGLSIRILHTDGVEDEGQVIRHDGDAIPLSEGADADGDESSLAVSGCRDKTGPLGRGRLFFHFDRILDFRHLELDQFVVSVAASVIFGQGVSSLLDLAVRNEPTGGLREEIEEAQLDDRVCRLQDGGRSPRPVVVSNVFLRAVCTPCS